MNAIVHANYSLMQISFIRIEFYPDKVEITSPGGLDLGSIDAMINGNVTYKNKNLIHILNNLGYVENLGTGLRRITKAYKEYLSDKNYNDIKSFFKVDEWSLKITLPNLNPGYHATNQYISKLNETELQIYELIKNNQQITVEEITNKIHKNRATIYRYFKKLESKGILKRIGNNKKNIKKIKQ